MSEGLFPVIHSLPSGEALIEKVLPKYPIPKPYRCCLHKRGLNDTYLVETGAEPYILRIYRSSWRSKAEIDFELELLTFLHQQRLPVAYPIATKQGSFTEAIAAPEGKRYIALFSYAPGRAVNEKLEPEESRKLGMALAQIHQTTDDFNSHFTRRELQNEYLLDWSWEKISSVFENQKRELNFINSQIENIKAELEVLALPKQAPAYGICVGDVHSGNAHFSDAKEPTLFDFDQCGYGWRAFDIGKFMDVTYAWKMSSAVRQAFLDGYQAIRQLSDREKHSIRTFTLTARIWVMGINTSVAGDVVPYGWFTDEWLESKLALLHQLDRNELDIVV